MNAYKGFIPKFHIDDEAGIIRGKVLNTRDTITFQGQTVREALEAFRGSVDDYLDFCKQIGIEPEKPYNGKLLVRLKPEVHRQLSLIAQERGQSVNSYVAGQLTKTIKVRDAASGLSGEPVETEKSPRLVKSEASRPKSEIKRGSK